MSINMNNQVTGGTVSVEDGVRAKEDYAPARKVRIDLNFSVPEGIDGIAMLDYVAAVANGRCLAMVHGKAPEGVKVVAVAETPAAPAKPGRKKAEVPAEPSKTKADLAAEAGLPTTDMVHKAPGGLVEEDETPAPKATAQPEDELGDLLGDAAPAPISDQELGRMAQDKMAKLKASQGEKFSPVAIRGLISTFSGGKRIADIPSEKRHVFKAALEALT